jgi:maltooligosyltrehalose trehalohydrolase
VRDARGPGRTLAPRLGAVPVGGGRTEFRIWAPAARKVLVGRESLAPEAGGFFAGVLAARPGDDYAFVIDGAPPRADPCSRWQPLGLRGPSRVLDPGSFEFAFEGKAVRAEELVIYELHPGTFTETGTFDAAAARLPALARLGVTAIELMPVGTFSGERGWGYDGVLTFAPHEAYGGPFGLARFVDAAHAEGLVVILDVVYNHIGAGAEALSVLGPYFTDRYETFWGEAIDYSSVGAREWAIQNAEQWVRDYRIDGLRLDATHRIFDESRVHVLRELADRVHAIRADALVIAESEIGDRRPLEEWGHDAQWDDDFHHALHALLTGEHDGYYAPYGTVEALARAFESTPAHRLVICAANHDQIGNRAFGDRLPPAARRLAAACVLFAPQIPLLFQGEEYGEQAPFLYFTDHDDPEIARAAREGREREFAAFSGFGSSGIPEPQARATFEASRLDPASGDAELRAFYAALIELRRSLPPTVETHVDEKRRILRVRRGAVELTGDFERQTVELKAIPG